MWYNDDAARREGNTLCVLRLVAERADGSAFDLGPAAAAADDDDDEAMTPGERAAVAPRIAALLAAARREAAEWGLEAVEAWNPGAATLEAARVLDASVDVCEREEEAIPSLRWKAAGDDVVWLGNEKYGWC
jgi:acyl-CoA reductase-like NAD-dependent aldehyde dehydrogenase